jgi:formamidopyrimidine-DNA glycosylase
MPELPEVETVVRDLRAHGLEGAVVRAVAVRWHRTVAGQPPERFAAALRGRRIVRVSRRGKHILLALDNGQVLQIHLRMTGKLRFAEPGSKPGPHDHVVVTLGDGRRLVFNDTRKFGRFRLADAADPALTLLGPEPLDEAFTVKVLQRQLAGKRRMIKPLLLDQAVVAGLGNIYVDESLWQARLHPERRADTLTPADVRRLHEAIREVLARAVRNNGTTLGAGEANFYSVAGRRGRNADALRVFRRTGEPCPRCGKPIARSVVGQRGTHYCPACQRGKYGYAFSHRLSPAFGGCNARDGLPSGGR